jgi:hypothetical protein
LRILQGVNVKEDGQATSVGPIQQCIDIFQGAVKTSVYNIISYNIKKKNARKKIGETLMYVRALKIIPFSLFFVSIQPSRLFE